MNGITETGADVGEDQELLEGWIVGKAFFECEKEAVLWKHRSKTLKEI